MPDFYESTWSHGSEIIIFDNMMRVKSRSEYIKFMPTTCTLLGYCEIVFSDVERVLISVVG